MTALKPLEERAVRGVASVRYPLNTVCAHPECTDRDVTAHHLFPRSQIGNGSWFVAIGKKVASEDEHARTVITKDAIAHVIGLCGHGTTGHHGDLEEHRAWVKLEDGVFVWYDRVETAAGWHRVGNLNPQPGSREGRAKRPRKREPAREKTTYCIRKPKDEAMVLPELEDALREKLASEMGWSETVPAYFVWAAAAVKALQ